MTSGGYTMTEAWNLQLQAQVRDLKAELAMTKPTWKGWVIMIGPRPLTDVSGEVECYRTKRDAREQRVRLEMDGWLGLTVERATLTLDTPKPKRKRR